MSDLAYTATLIGGFTAVALLVRFLGLTLNAAERRSERKDHGVPEGRGKDRARRGAVRETRG